MRIRTEVSGILVCLVVVWTLFIGGCNGNKESSSAEQTLQRATDAAVVPNADFIVRVDINAIRQAPIVKQLEKDEDNTVDTKPAFEKFRQATGLSKDDVQAVVLSADTTDFDFANGTNQTNLAQLTGVAAIALGKPLTTDKLMEGLKAVLDDSKATLSKFDMDGTQAVLVQSTKPDEPSAYAATSSDTKTVYIAFNKMSLQAALQREKKGVAAASSPALQALSNPTSQANVAFVAPQGLRDKIQAQLSKSQESQGGAMLSGFIAPFKDLQSIALGINWDTGMQLDIAGDLGTAQAATQVSALIQTMAMPMLKNFVAKSSGQTPLNLDEQFNVSTENTTLRISLRFTGENIQAFRQAKNKAKTAALSQQQ